MSERERVFMTSKLALLAALQVTGCDFIPKGNPPFDPLAPPVVVSARAIQRGDEIELVLQARHGVPTDFDLVSFPGAITDDLVVLGDGVPLGVVAERHGGAAEGADVIVELESAKRVQYLQLDGYVVVINSDRSPMYRARAPAYVEVNTPDIGVTWQAVQHDGFIDLKLEAETGSSQAASRGSFDSIDPTQLVVRAKGGPPLRLQESTPLRTERGTGILLRLHEPGPIDELELEGRLLFRGPDRRLWAEPPEHRVTVTHPADE